MPTSCSGRVPGPKSNFLSVVAFLSALVVFLSSCHAQNDDKLRELIRRTEEAEKNDSYDADLGKKKMDAGFAISLDKAVMAGMKAFLPGEDALEVFKFTGSVSAGFIKKMTLYPYVDALEVNATPKSFLAALDNIRKGGAIEAKSGQLGRFCELTACSPTRDNIRVALGTLLSASGSYTDTRDRFHDKAYNAVLRVITPETIAKNKKYFDSPAEACFVMLYAGGRFARPDGEIDEKAYGAALQRLTPERIEAVKKMMQKPNSQRACDAILRP